MNAPVIEYTQLLPVLIVFGAAIVGVLIEAFVSRDSRRALQIPLTFASLVAGFVTLFFIDDVPNAAAMGAIGIDAPTLFIQGTILLLAIVSVLLVSERKVDGGGPFVAEAAALPGSEQERRGLQEGAQHTEVYPLVLFAVGGMLLFPASNDLLMMFVALEVMSLPLYLLCGLARRRRLLSQEAALKYFLLGAFASAFFLYGVALLYGYAGTIRLAGIAQAASTSAQSDILLYAGLALLAVGLLFKLGAVPFHAWTPDVYQGAPTAITAFMSACTKVAAFGALLRVFYVAFGGLRWDWRPMMWVIAILTMVVGSVLAITQTDIKRMLAYSSIAHAGFILTAVIDTSTQGLSSALFYLAAYGFSVIGAFAIVTLVRDGGGEANDLSRWVGLGRRSPVVAAIFAFFLLAFAGIPLTSGFTGKYAVFLAAVDGGALPLVIVGLLSSVVAAFFYVRVIVLMFFQQPKEEAATVAVPSMYTSIAIGLGVAVTVVLGIVPGPVLQLAQQAAQHLFVG
ncbi:MAG: NADH-quinone oxidoreductase subunit NuoN [Streptosporangiales bacterium]|nr:NADH-quinone oxidoreductase subunit NuoN [Streptosporangiales bacterium]